MSTGTRTSRLVTAVLVAGSASFGLLPLAHADTETQQVVPTTEAWYQPNPTCGAPTGCVGLGSLPVQPPVAPPAEIPTSPYPAGSMHVAVDAGQETARTYLAFSLPLFDSTLTAASLDIPLDLAQADGSIAPENAQVRVCSYQGSITAANGSIEQPPAAMCAASAKASYVPTNTPHLHADLAPLLSALSAGGGLVLIPDAETVAPGDTWRVVFSAHDRADDAKTPPARMTVTVSPVETPDYTQPPFTPPVTAIPPTLGPVSAPPPGLDVPMGPTVQNPVPNVPVQPVPQARTVTVGYAYPTVWLLPLVFLLVVPLVARTLTKDLTPTAT